MPRSPGRANADLVGKILHITAPYGLLATMNRHPDDIASTANELKRQTEIAAGQKSSVVPPRANGSIAGPQQ